MANTRMAERGLAGGDAILKPSVSRILKPVLIDAETGAFTTTRELPWYAQALFVSQPLHFGDYAGLPLKIVWALLDLVTIILLGSGVYLWVTRRETQIHGTNCCCSSGGPNRWMGQALAMLTRQPRPSGREESGDPSRAR
jgi:uncharacterized iron-regulated membrane protein